MTCTDPPQYDGRTPVDGSAVGATVSPSCDCPCACAVSVTVSDVVGVASRRPKMFTPSVVTDGGTPTGAIGAPTVSRIFVRRWTESGDRPSAWSAVALAERSDVAAAVVRDART